MGTVGVCRSDGCPRVPVPSPLTETLSVEWRPSLRYHQHRLEVLEALQSARLLTAWRVSDEEIGARTEVAELTMRDTGVLLSSRRSLTSDEVSRIFRLVLGAVAPPEYHFHVAYQYLEPIADRTYDEARTFALNRMSFGLLGARDCAVVMDGPVSDRPWHVEFGIVSPDEVEVRLRRWVGSSAQNFGTNFSTFFEAPPDVAPVSLFADLLWAVPERDAANSTDDTVHDLSQEIQELADKASEIVSQIQACLVSEDALQPVAEGSDS